MVPFSLAARLSWGEMPIAPLPSPLQDLGGRRFLFYPPIRNIDHNEWVFRRATWSECIVANMSSGEEVCVPRSYIGDISSTDEPVAIVGLIRELQWSDGAVVPYQRRVIALPVAVNAGWTAPPRPARLAPVVNIRLEQKSEVRVGKWIGVALVLGVAVLTIVSNIGRQSETQQRADFYRASHAWQQLRAGDDYAAIVARLGKPSEDRSRDQAGRVYRMLRYAPRHFSVMLMDAGYIGTVSDSGRVLDAANGPAIRSRPAF